MFFNYHERQFLTFSKKNFYCANARYHPSKLIFEPAVSFTKKIGREKKLFNGGCGLCGRTKTKNVSDNTKKSEVSENLSSNSRKRCIKQNREDYEKGKKNCGI